MVSNVAPSLVRHPASAQHCLYVNVPHTWEEVRNIVGPNNLRVLWILASLKPSKGSVKGAEAGTPTDKHDSRLPVCVVNQPFNCGHNARQQTVQEELVFTGIHVYRSDFSWFLDINLLRGRPNPSLPLHHPDKLSV